MKRATLRQTMQTRIVTYHIDDEKYFRNYLIAHGVEEDAIKATIDCVNAFKARYTLIGTPGQYPDRYELYDEAGKKMNMLDLNGYQKGVVLNGCIKHYMGELPESDITGVIAITENLTENVA